MSAEFTKRRKCGTGIASLAGVELGGVEDLEAFAAADGRRIGAEDGLHQAIERASGDALAGAVADFFDGLEEPGHVIAGLGGDQSHRGVIEEEELGSGCRP